MIIQIGVIPAEHNYYIIYIYIYIYIMFRVRLHLNLCFGTHTIEERSISGSKIQHCHSFQNLRLHVFDIPTLLLRYS